MSEQWMPAYSMPDVNRRVLLARRPNGIPLAEHFALDQVPIEPVGPGQFLVRNIYLSVDPAMRGWTNEAANYADPVPLGSVMRALAVGQIVQSEHADFQVGCYVYGWFGWQHYCVASPDRLMTSIDRLQAPLSAYAGVLGINGLTAWLALNKIGQPAPGDVVLVSTAAGAVGSVVGQLARAAGCEALGLAGDDEKVARCIERFAYSAAANYRTAEVGASIDRLAPSGIDVYFDNVGGPILDAVLRRMRPGGRIVQCGTAAVAIWAPPPQGPRPEREILMRRLQWGGFVIFDHAADYARAMNGLSALLTSGHLAYDEDVAAGLEAAPDLIRRIYAGENAGKQLIFVG